MVDLGEGEGSLLLSRKLGFSIKESTLQRDTPRRRADTSGRELAELRQPEPEEEE